MKQKTIYKYQLDLTDRQNVKLPENAQILTIQVQHGIVCLWALVDPTAPEGSVHIEIFGTGHPVVEDGGTSRKYISTFQMEEGALVFHAFEYIGI